MTDVSAAGHRSVAGNRVDGKVALVTGGARGIGAAAARLLAANGAGVVITDMLTDAGEATAADIRAGGGDALFLTQDVADEAGWPAVVAAVEERFGGLHVLVNNAGIFFTRWLEETTLEDWHRMSRVNLDGVFLGTRQCLPLMKRSVTPESPGSIVNLSSVAGLVGAVRTAAYNMTKGGVRLFTKCVALECAKLDYAIRCNSIHPGVMDTAMADTVVENAAILSNANDLARVREAVGNRHPVGRMGTAEDVARAILFLASDDSSFMTGAELLVDGGWTAQ